MNFFKNRLVIAVLFFAMGVFTVKAYDYYKFLKNPRPRYGFPIDEMLGNDPKSLFEEFFGDANDMMAQLPHQLDTFELHNSDLGEIETREDDQYLYYEIDLKGKTPKEMRVSVENGQMTISGQMESNSQEKSSSLVMSMSFHRSFPIPPDVDADKYSMEQVGEKLVIKLPKRAT